MNGFKFDFSKIFWGGAPDPSPAFSWASPLVRALPSILGRFAPLTPASPSILGRFAPSIRALPSTFDWGPWFGPPKINSWICQCLQIYRHLQTSIEVLYRHLERYNQIHIFTEVHTSTNRGVIMKLQFFSSIKFNSDICRHQLLSMVSRTAKKAEIIKYRNEKQKLIDCRPIRIPGYFRFSE